MDLQIAGRRALVTGSTDGIGKAIALMLAQEGALVVIHGRNKAKAETVVQEIAARDGEAFVAPGDLRTDENDHVCRGHALF